MNSLVNIRVESDIFVLTLDDATRRNALSLRMRQELNDRLQELMGEKACRAIVLTGAGGNFCVGGDVNQMDVKSEAESRARLDLVHRIIRMVVTGPKPVLAAVHGIAAGGGVSIVAGSDYAVAATTARLTSSFLRTGVIPDLGALWTIPQRMGLGEARRFFCRGKTLSGDDAARLGLVDQAVESQAVLETALLVAAEFAAIPPKTFAFYKSAISNRAATFEDALDGEIKYQPQLLMSKDQKEAVAAFLQKRKPNFIGE